MGTIFFFQIEPIATQIPYLVCIGNHEYDYIGQPFNPSWSDYDTDSNGECGVPFNARFQMPDASGVKNLWWSINYGLVHFIFISTEHNWMSGSEQYVWIQQDLSSVNRTQTPWIIFSGHRPMYTGMLATGSTVRVSNYMKAELEPLLQKYSVDLCLWGHVHNYERTCPVLNEQCQGDLQHPGGPVHVVIGMAGQSLSFDWADPVPDWSMFRAADFGYTRITVSSPTQLHLQFIGDKDGQVHDRMTLHKKQNHWI